jgi:hypothetical protein
MNLSPLTPLFVSLTLGGVMVLGARSHRRIEGDVEIYKYPAAVAYLMGFCGLFFLAVPFLPGARGDMSQLSFFAGFAGFAACAMLAAGYFLRFRVTIDTKQLCYGAFSRRTVDLSEIVDAKVQRGSKSAQLFVKLQTGRKITFSGMLADFDSLASRMVSCALHNTGKPSDAATIERMMGRIR